MTTPVALHVHRWNPAGDRRALLLHGLGSDGRTMWRLASVLADDGFDVVAPDLRGHGLSPATRRYDLDGYTADVRLLGGRWDLVIGHSLGGSIAAHLLADDGVADRGVLLDPVLRLEAPARQELERDLATEVGGTLTGDQLRREHPTWDEEDIFRKVAAAATVSPRVTSATLTHNDPWDVMSDAGRWEVPVTILAADPARDALFLPDHADELAAAGVAADVVTIHGAGHSVHRDAPADVIERLRRATRA